MKPRGNYLSQLITLLRSSATPYLTVVLLSLPLSMISYYLFKTTPFFKGQSLGIIFPIIGIGLGAMLWLFYRSETRATRGFIFFGISLFALWAYVTLRSLSLNEPYNYNAWLLPFFLLMVIFKPPTRNDTLKSADYFVFGILVIAAMSHVLHVTGIYLFPHYLNETLAYTSRLPEIVEKLLPMQSLGLDYRWAGPFGSVSDAGPMGAIIFSYGLFRTGFTRIVSLSGGLFILVFAFSFSSIFATLAAIGFLVAVKLSNRFPDRRTSISTGIFSGIFLVIMTYIWFFNQDLNGRTQIWVQYISEFPNHLFLGAGSEFMSTQTDILSHDHAHNLYFDTLLRYGAVGFILFLILLFAIARLTWKSLKTGSSLPIIILIVFALCIVGESLVLWRYNGILTTWLIIAAMIANSEITIERTSGSTDTVR
jgi:hypothetical protein